MKSTGIIRKIDQLGRVVLPKELRDTLNINNKDGLEIFTDSDMVILKKYKPSHACFVTNEVSEKNIQIGDKFLSPQGLEAVLNVAKKEGLL